MPKKTDVNEFDFEGEPPGETEETPVTGKGLIVSKAALVEWTGLAAATVDRAFKDGAPYLSKGSRKQGYRINSAQWFDWYWRQKVLVASGDPDAQSYEVAKLRDKEAQATLRELQIQKREGKLIEMDAVQVLISETSDEIRTRILALSSQVPTLDPSQRDQLDSAINDLLTDISEKQNEPEQHTPEKASEGP